MIVIGVFLYLALQACSSLSGSDKSAPEPESTASTPPSCPPRIAAELPGTGSGAELVDAFSTQNKQIVLCRTGEEELFYFGEFSDRREGGIAMPARTTADGYEASNGPYRYRIDVKNQTVTIYESGQRIGRESLRPQPSPS
ncbi:hypothetical protein [Streptomyces sp. NPDC048442]|uniref:hypothetical protein n=1 Tax=Streptomyces sp. NPDC048442 TaxID=3154823 RepID=UPI0034417066